MNKSSASTDLLQRPLELPCGAVLKNRLVKSPMSDSLADGEGNPTETQMRLYERWAEGGTALSCIGEVQVDPRYPEKPGNLVLGSNSDLESLQQLTKRSVIDGAHLWAQLGHAGALSHSPISQPKGPSPLDLEGLQCEGLSVDEVLDLADLYGNAAWHAEKVGFSGVMIHAGHGFLLSQFLSPLFNHRSDGFGGSIAERCRVIFQIIGEVRRSVSPSFPVGIRINSTDQLEGGLTAEDALEAIRLLDDTPIDLIDISGGTYFPGAKASSDGSGQGPYFLEFAKLARTKTRLPLMVTGGFKTRTQAVNALASGAVDMVGLARAMVMDPALANNWISGDRRDPEFPQFESTVPGGVTAWYTMRITALGEDREQAFSMDLPSAVREYDARDAERCIGWRNKFPLSA